MIDLTRRTDAQQPAMWPLLIPSMLLLVITVVSFLYFTLDRFEERLMPEIQSKADGVMQAISLRVERAFVLGATLRNLRGAEDTFHDALEANPEIVSITLSAPDGTIVTAVANPRIHDTATPPVHETRAMPVTLAGKVAGILTIEVDSGYARRVLASLMWDIVGVLLVVLTTAFGLLTFIIQGGFGTGIDSLRSLAERLTSEERRRLKAALAALRSAGRPALPSTSPETLLLPRLLALRVVIFVFFLGEEMLRPFLPEFIHSLAISDPGPLTAVDSRMMVGIALSLFIVVLSLVQLWGGRWSEHIGRMRTLLLGVLLSSLGMIATAICDTLTLVLLARGLTAAGYGLVFIAAQGVAIDLTSRDNRTTGMSMFVGGVMAALLVGPSIGGLTADHLGPRIALVVAAAVSGAAAILAILLLPRTTPLHRPENRSVLADLQLVLSNHRMTALIALSAIPAKIILNTIVFYLVPLTLAERGESLAAVGRIVMVYGLFMVLFGGLAARVGDRSRENLALMVVAGAILSGLGVMVAGWLGIDFWTAALAIAALGLGQAMSVAPQLALVPEICHREVEIAGHATVLGIFRLLERLGGAIGPVLGGWLAMRSTDIAFTAVGLGVALAGLAYLGVELLVRTSRSHISN